MQTLRIRNFKARYRLPASASGERRRLDEALRAALAGPLEDELRRLGISDSEEVCIRDVFAPARLRLSVTDASLAREWGRAIAEAIALAVEGRRTPGVVRYASRVQALVDMAEGVVLEDLSRAWAWRQLGLWGAAERATRQEAVDELVYALASEPSTVVPVSSTLAARGLFRRLAPRLTRGHWRTLALAASEAAGAQGASEWLGGPASLTARRPASPEEQTGAQPTAFTPELMREAVRAVSASSLARDFAFSHASAAGEETERAFAVLVILESNQSALSPRAEDARALVGAVVLALKSVEGARALARGSEAPAEGRGPEGARAGETEEGRSGVASASDAPGAEAAGVEARGREEFFKADDDEERPLPVVRRRAFTRFGGLLFLLNLLEDLGLPREMSGDEALRERTLRWSLHRLALTLVPEAATDDPAALAFAGLAPDAAPPSESEEGPSDAESEALASYAARAEGALRERLEERRDEPRASLLAFVCGRRAEVIADPGWFEVRLSLDDVDMDVRRSGLDLDPGYLRWLGAVVKFVYE